MSADENARDDAPSSAREAAVAVIALLVAGLVGSGWSLGFHLDNAHNGLVGLSFTAVGLYIVRMRPHHREGVLFVAVGILHAVMFFGRQYGSHDGPLPGAEWIGWIGVWPLALAIALVAWTLMAFPDGRLLSLRWRVAGGAMIVVAFGLSVVSALWPVDYERTSQVAPLSVGCAGSGWGPGVLGWRPRVFPAVPGSVDGRDPRSRASGARRRGSPAALAGVLGGGGDDSSGRWVGRRG